MSRGNIYSQLYEMIFLFLSIPCFKVRHFFFKLAYLLQQRRLSHLGRECAFKGGYDLSLQFDAFLPTDSSIVGIYDELRKICDRAERAKQGSKIGSIGHGNPSLMSLSNEMLRVIPS